MGQAVVVRFSELVQASDGLSQSLDDKIQEAFGSRSDCLGIIVVSDLPVEYQEMRKRLLMMSSVIANLPEDTLEKLEDAGSSYLVGWSRGRERLGKSGREDVQKGSYYANPVNDGDGNTQFPEYCNPNIWPDQQDAPGFQSAFEELGRFIVGIGKLVARACDLSMKQHSSNYAKNYLEEMIIGSKTTKARLLHYYPSPSDTSQDSNDDDSWCGEHLDHSLTSALYIDETPGSTPTVLKGSPDASAGLYIRNRAGDPTKVAIPSDCLAFQTGEALQIVTDGGLKAVPHYVKGCNVPNVARNTFAVFMQPNLEDKLGTSHYTFADFAKGIVSANYDNK